MRLSKETEQEIRQIYQAYWDAYLSGDFETFASFLDNDIVIYGTAVGEIFTTKEDALKFYTATSEEMTGKAEFRNKDIRIEPVGDIVVIYELSQLYILIEDTWTFYGFARITGIFEKKDNQWKLVHQHGSFPDSRTEEGQQIASEKIKEENLQLKEAVKRRTMELENKTRELEIESSLERVRTVAMGMRKPDDMLSVCEVIAGQLQSLGVSGIRNVQTAIIDEGGKGTYMNYQYFAQYQERTVEHVDSARHPKVKDMIQQMQASPDAFFSHSFEGVALEEWKQYRKDDNQFPDPILEKSSVVHFYFYSIGEGGLGLSTYTPLTEDKIGIFHKFRNVFALAYQRFRDIEHAEAQAREAQIELALERVRARTMAMQHSEELSDVVKLLYQEFDNLKISNESTDIEIGLINEETGIAAVWAHLYLSDGTISTFSFPFAHFDEINHEFQQWKNTPIDKRNELFITTEFSGDLWDKFVVLANEVPELAEMFRSLIEANITKWVTHNAYFSHGLLTLQGTEAYPPETLDIQKRFAKVFEQTYIRFLDLEKAEANAREVQLELSLERIRSQVTAMQESSDLLDIVVAMRTEFVNLGHEAHYFWHMRWLPESYAKAMTSGDGTKIGMVMSLPRHIHGDIEQVANWEKSNEIIHVLAMDAEMAVDYVHKMITLGDFERVDPQSPTLDDIRAIGGLTFVMARTTHGEIGYSLPGVVPDPSKDAVNTLVRFAGVFDLAYKRFEDLKARERQHREGQIELALEKVRSRTMGMQSSEELPEVANVLFLEVQSLGIPAWSCGYNILSEDKKTALCCMSSEGTLQTPFTLRLWGEASFDEMGDFVKSEKTMLVQELGDKALKEHYTHMKSFPDLKPTFDQIDALGLSLPTYQINHLCKFSKGFLLFITYKPVPESHEIFNRFTKIFDQTYTRFLDLKKAENQAREAQIENALEKVRSRSLAMQSPDELIEVAQLLREEMGALGVEELETSSIYIHDEENETTQCWFTIKNAEDPEKSVTDQMTLDLQHTWVGRKMMEFYRSPAHHTSILMQGENRIEWIRYCEEKSALFSTSSFYGETIPSRTYHLYKFSNGFVGAASPGQISTESWELLKRATNVFSFAYTRFHDLQVAEASAWIAMRQASLDRVRADIASMRSIRDLQRITPLIWQELTNLQVSFIRCGVFIMDEDAQLVHTYLSTADGKDIAAIHLPYTGMSITENAIAHWRKQAVYIDHWDKAGFQQWTKQLIDQGHITSTETYQGGAAPDHLHLHFVPFAQGMLYVGSALPLPEESIDLIQSLAAAFATAYARYEDFNKLEAAKKSTDLALADLEAAKDQLVQQEKLASLGQLTAGIAHEIKNPLNFVTNFSEVSSELLDELLEELEKGNANNIKSISDAIKSNLHKIHEHGSRADSIVKSMLMHSRGGSGQKEPTDLNAVIREYVNLTFHGMRAGKYPINVHIDLQLDETTGLVPIIAEDISRVIINLCNNAFDAMRTKLNDPSGESGYVPRLSVRTKRDGKLVKIEIADNGPGIPDDIKDKILQPFFTTKKGTQGTGLGLSITNDIVKAHGGELKIESQPGHGAGFIISLPKLTAQ